VIAKKEPDGEFMANLTITRGPEDKFAMKITLTGLTPLGGQVVQMKPPPILPKYTLNTIPNDPTLRRLEELAKDICSGGKGASPGTSAKQH
jgi:hypothetical protein